MPSALVPLFDGFEEIEAVTVVDLLRRAGVEVVTAGVAERRVTGGRNMVMEADKTFAEAITRSYDMIVLPGGPGTGRLNDTPGMHDLLRQQGRTPGRWVAAICAAPSVLAAAGLLQGRSATCYPSAEPKMAGAKLERAAVVVDGNIVTSRGAGTAADFALKLIAVLCGDDAAKRVADAILYTGSRAA